MKEAIFVFDMPKVVHIRKPSLAVLHRITQTLILTYFVIYVMWFNKGYQCFDRAISGVTAKLKGIAWMYSYPPDMRLDLGPIILDESEYRLQPVQNSGFYLITRIASHTIQELTLCPESYHLPDARCFRDSDCPTGTSAGLSVIGPDGLVQPDHEIDIDEYGHGIYTGRCVNLTGTCEVFAWCPVQENTDFKTRSIHKRVRSKLIEPPNILDDHYSVLNDFEFLNTRRKLDDGKPGVTDPIFEVLNFTVLLKNSIEFPYFKVKRRNMLPWMSNDYIRQCFYNQNHPKDQYCPKFRIGDIIRSAGSNIENLLRIGGVLVITITWECNLDWSIDYCLPKYEFFQLDSSGYHTQKDRVIPLGEGSTVEISSHYGSKNYTSHGKRRILTQVNGIQFLIRVIGRAGKFNLLSFTMRFGSGLALLSIASILNDMILFHFTHDREHYRKATCDDKTLKRLLSIAASVHLPPSRRTLLLNSNRKMRKHTKSVTKDRNADLTKTNNVSKNLQIPQIELSSINISNNPKPNLDLELICPSPSSSQIGDGSICSSQIFIPPARSNIVQSPRCISTISNESKTSSVSDQYFPDCI